MRKSATPRSRPSVSVRETMLAVHEAEKVRNQVHELRRVAGQRRADRALKVTEAARMTAEKLWGERAELEVGLAEQLRIIHKLEGQSQDFSEKSSRQRQRAGALHKHIKAAEADAIASGAHVRGDHKPLDMVELRDMNEGARRYKEQAQDLEKQMQQAYHKKDVLEVEIVNRRHAAAITEHLHRARMELLPEVLDPQAESDDEMPSDGF
mmetsp:Transcript_14427/g.36965  ORF Transcript_14427/g.36965 Transcript_14427/m.36965 type:complete len:209 (+) Transcript_14427:73-699(+)